MIFSFLSSLLFLLIKSEKLCKFYYKSHSKICMCFKRLMILFERFLLYFLYLIIYIIIMNIYYIQFINFIDKLYFC